MEFAYYNGKIMPYKEVNIPLSDRAVFFGDGVYDCMIGGKGNVYQIDKHLERLRTNTRLLTLDFSLTNDSISEIISSLISLSKFEYYTVYIQVSRRGELRRHYCKDFTRSNLCITVTELNPEFNPAPISLISTEDIRYRMCHIKTLNLLPSVLAAAKAEGNGADETVFIRDGIVTECSHSNVSILKNDTLYTHPLSRDILPGIMRENLIHECKEMGIQVKEECYGYNELISADEVIVTSTTHFARRVRKIDENSINLREKSAFYELSERLLKNFAKCCC